MSALFAPGRVAVVTGAASGIGRAAAGRFARAGMRLVLFDTDGAALGQAALTLDADVRVVVGDVARMADVERLRDVAYGAFGEVALLMNNAAVGGGSANWAGLDAWKRTFDVNLWGVVNGVHAFAAAMLEQGAPAAIVNTGSKQGITNPPGDPAYAVSKAGVRTLTEQLAHALREEPGSQVSAHLLVPGWTFTGMTRTSDGEKPAGAWTADQVVERMVAGVDADDFYIICPDNAVSSAVDAARLRWGAEDLAQNRPALSRWHPDWRARFDAFVEAETGK